MIRDYKPNKVPTNLSGINRIRTLDAHEAMWSYLDRYRSYEFVAEKLRTSIAQNHALIERKAEQITATIVQAKSYFTSAAKSPLEISPLIYYYGMESLAKCLILSGDNTYTLDYSNPLNRDHRHHGLSFPGSNQADQAIREGNGLFDEFCTVETNPTKQVGTYNLLRSCFSNDLLPNGFRANIKDLLSLVPETKPDFFTLFNEAPRYWHADAHFGIRELGASDQLIEFADYDWHFHKQEGESYAQTILRRFPMLTTHYQAEGVQEDTFRTVSDATSIDDCVYVSSQLTGEYYALTTLDGHVLSDIDTHFLLMFILSNLVRYHQAKWANLVSRKHNTDIFLIENFVSIAAKKFPLLILRELDNYMYEFIGPVATWG